MTADNPTSVKLRARMWVDAKLVSDDVALVDFNNPDSVWPWVKDLAEKHGLSASAAECAGLRYLVEIEWWDGERTRFGTDVDGMVVPVEVGLHEMVERISERWQS